MKQKQLKSAQALLGGVSQLLETLPDFGKASAAEKRQIEKLLDARQALRAVVDSMQTLTKA